MCKTEPDSKVQVPKEEAKSSAGDTPSHASSTKSLTIVRSSKFRHIEGKFKHQSTFITKLPSLSSTVPGDSNAFQANRDRVAAVLSTSGGQIGVFEVS